jgi:hypothetical protein
VLASATALYLSGKRAETAQERFQAAGEVDCGTRKARSRSKVLPEAWYPPKMFENGTH